jgi:hypothetical protein
METAEKKHQLHNMFATWMRRNIASHNLKQEDARFRNPDDLLSE